MQGKFSYHERERERKRERESTKEFKEPREHKYPQP